MLDCNMGHLHGKCNPYGPWSSPVTSCYLYELIQIDPNRSHLEQHWPSCVFQAIPTRTEERNLASPEGGIFGATERFAI